MKINLKDASVRYAIYKAHDYKCYYSKKRIEFQDMTLDHIIPKRLLYYPSELSETKLRLELPNDFDLDSIENIVPCHRTENQDKRDDVLSNAAVAVAVAKRKAKSIKTILEEWSKTKEAEVNILLTLKPEIIDKNILSPEAVYNLINDENSHFYDFESYVNDIHFGSFSASKGRVYLMGYLPSLHNNGASCKINFKSIEIRSLFLTFSQRDIAALSSEAMRAKLVRIDNQIGQDGKVLFQYKFVNFIAGQIEVKELIDLINQFNKKIEIAEAKIDEYYGATKFVRSQNNAGYVMGPISRDLWMLIRKYGSEFDIDKGVSEWHIFDVRLGSVIISSNEKNIKYGSGFHACFTFEEIERNSKNEVNLVWNKLSDSNGKFNEKSYWDASIAHAWVFQKLIPHVLTQRLPVRRNDSNYDKLVDRLKSMMVKIFY